MYEHLEAPSTCHIMMVTSGETTEKPFGEGDFLEQVTGGLRGRGKQP